MSSVAATGGLSAKDFALEDEKAILAAAATLTEGADAAASVATAYQISVGDVFDGRLDVVGDHDWVRLDLAAGQTVRIDLEGLGVDYLSDPFLRVRDSDGDLIERNDDNLGARDSHLVFTAPTTGAFYLDLGAFDDNYAGDYRLTVSPIDETTDAPASAATPFVLDPGETFTGNDVSIAGADWIGLNVTKGVTYFVKVRMIAADGDQANEGAGRIVNASGQRVVSSLPDRIDGDDSYFVFTASRTERLYAEVRIEGSGEGYEVQFEEYSPAAAVTWREADPIVSDPIKVYLYDAGEIIDFETETYFARNFTVAGREAIGRVLDDISNFVDVEFEFTDTLAEADFRLGVDNLGRTALGFMAPQGGGQEVEGAAVFNGRSEFYNGSTLQRGGLMYATMVHEIGHGLGLAHPHDDGGNSPLFPGVRNSEDFGDFSLSQDMFTVMSYNTTSFELGRGSPGNFSAGYMSTLAPLDIAALQAMYGANDGHAAGDDTYTLRRGAPARAIWDVGGTDSIVAQGGLDAVIDLRAATLRHEEGGGGRLSYLDNGLGARTIAGGVTIENAVGGDGDDAITGNEVGNRLLGKLGSDVLRGLAGDDTIAGGRLFDTLRGGLGDDELRGGGGRDAGFGGSGADTVKGGGGRDELFGADGADRVVGGGGDDTLEGGRGGDTVRGGAGDDLVIGGGGDDLIFGGGGADTLIAGRGDDTLTGGGGPDAFVFAAGQNVNRIEDFGDGLDILQLRGVDGIDELTISQGGDGAVIRFDGTTIVLVGVDRSEVGEDDFLFG